MRRVLNVGSLNLDHVYQVPHLVRPGETLASARYARFLGGKGFNQSIALARAGAKVTHAGCVGSDGGALRDQLAAEAIDTSRIRTLDTPTGHAIIQVAPDGENAIVLFPGANAEFTSADVARSLDGFGRGDWLVCQNETSAIPELLTSAADRGLTVCFNPAPMSPAVRDWPLARVDWLILNEIEAAELIGLSDPLHAAAEWRARHPRTSLVITLGGDGLVCGHAGEIFRQPAHRVAAVDATAAGDTFIGYFVAALADGATVRSALEAGSRAAAICVSRPGAAASIPDADEVAAFVGRA